MSVKLKGSEAFQHIQLDVLTGTISRLPLVSFNVASFMKTLIDMSELRFADFAQARGEYLRWDIRPGLTRIDRTTLEVAGRG